VGRKLAVVERRTCQLRRANDAADDDAVDAGGSHGDAQEDEIQSAA